MATPLAEPSISPRSFQLNDMILCAGAEYLLHLFFVDVLGHCLLHINLGPLVQNPINQVQVILLLHLGSGYGGLPLALLAWYELVNAFPSGFLLFGQFVLEFTKRRCRGFRNYCCCG